MKNLDPLGLVGSMFFKGMPYNRVLKLHFIQWPVEGDPECLKTIGYLRTHTKKNLVPSSLLVSHFTS